MRFLPNYPSPYTSHKISTFSKSFSYFHLDTDISNRITLSSSLTQTAASGRLKNAGISSSKPFSPAFPVGLVRRTIRRQGAGPLTLHYKSAAGRGTQRNGVQGKSAVCASHLEPRTARVLMRLAANLRLSIIRMVTR